MNRDANVTPNVTQGVNRDTPSSLEGVTMSGSRSPFIDRLARLVKAGRVERRDSEFERRHPEVAGPFIKRVEARVLELRGIKAPRRAKRARRKRK